MSAHLYSAPCPLCPPCPLWLKKMSTLYEDWQRRRDRMLEQPGGRESTDAYFINSLRVLEYLLERYKDSPIAAMPARFPLLSGMLLDRRTIVVHHHLARNTS